MSGQTSTLKRQLRGVRSTRKITNAMSLVATAKLQRQREKAYQNDQFAQYFHEALLMALSARHDGPETDPYFLAKPGIDNPLHIIITSNSGLCGSYNVDMMKYVEQKVGRYDPIFSLGSYGTKWLHANGYAVVKSFTTELENLRPSLIDLMVSDVLTLFRENEISSADIIYTQYVNTLTFTPSTYELLPLKVPEGLENKDIEMAPDRQTVIDALVPQYISAIVYDTFLEAKTSENAARRSSMEAANKNAEILIEQLTLEYNQARQAAITQEVNEITAGAGQNRR
jgi:F-type H+-transporting ATPase subunit gamma